MASPGGRIQSAGRVTVSKEVEPDLAGCEAMEVEGTLDCGLFARVLVDHLAHRGPRRTRPCALGDEPGRRRVPI